MTDQNMPSPGSSQNPADQTAPLEPGQPTITTTAAPKARSMIREIAETLVLALLIFVLVRAVVLNFRVEGHSMDSSLHNNEMLLVNRNAYLTIDGDKWFGWIPFVRTDPDEVWRPFGIPERGDIIVLNPPGVDEDKPYIKRVIGVPGDTLEIRDDGVFIDGVRIDEPYIDSGNLTQCRQSGQYCGPIEIPDGYVYVLGDNRMNSKDSRYFGLVPIGNIIGKAWITYWPVGDIGVVPHNDYPELASQQP